VSEAAPKLEDLQADASARMMSIARPGLVGRAIDRVVGALSPSMLAAREEARTAAAMAVFQAAEVSRLTASWDAPETSGDGAMMADAGLMNARARGARRDNWAVASIVDSYRRDIGCQTPRASAFDLRTNEKLVEFNRRLDFWWRRWAASPGLCDFYGQQSLSDLMGLTVEEAVQTGQGFVVPSIEDRGGPVPLTLELFEFEQLATELYRAPNGNEIKLGVEVDQRGVAVAYHFYRKGHPLELERGEVERIPADRVLVLAQFDRTRSVLPSSVLSAVLTSARSLDTYLSYEDRAKHIEACVSLQLRKDKSAGGTKPGTGIGMASKGTQETLTDTNGRKVSRMESGTIYDPPPGMHLESVSSQRPGGAFESYTRTRSQHIAAGANRSKSTMTRDYTSSYTAERRGEVEDLKVNRMWQERQVTQLLMPIRRLFIDLAILMGKVEVPAEILRDKDLREALYETEWMPPRREPIDPSKQAAAQKIRLEQRLTNHGRELNEEGRDWHDNFDDIAEQEAYAEEKGIDIPRGGGGVDPSEPRPRGESRSPDGAGGDEDDGGDDGDGDDEEARGGVKPQAALAGGVA
jgi:lambda family phage portal protein